MKKQKTSNIRVQSYMILGVILLFLIAMIIISIKETETFEELCQEIGGEIVGESMCHVGDKENGNYVHLITCKDRGKDIAVKIWTKNDVDVISFPWIIESRCTVLKATLPKEKGV